MLGKILNGGRQTKLLPFDKAPEVKRLLELYERFKDLEQHFKYRILIT